MKKGDFLVPYNKGSLLEWSALREGETVEDKSSYSYYPDQWLPNEPFSATLTITGFSRGRSSAKFYFESAGNLRFPMFMTDMVDLVRTAKIDKGVVSGRWIVRKRGANYGIAYL